MRSATETKRLPRVVMEIFHRSKPRNPPNNIEVRILESCRPHNATTRPINTRTIELGMSMITPPTAFTPELVIWALVYKRSSSLYKCTLYLSGCERVTMSGDEWRELRCLKRCSKENIYGELLLDYECYWECIEQEV
jgi:hypothetical protein